MIKLIEQGHSVHNMALSMCGEIRLWQELEDSCTILGVTNSLHNFTVRHFHNYREKLAEFFYSIRNDYDCVFTHSVLDKHLDHRVVAEESKRIFNCNLFTYIATWNGQQEENYFVELTATQLSRKVDALLCYKSQLNRDYFEPDFIRAQARYNGIKCGKLYAEAFKIERLIQ